MVKGREQERRWRAGFGTPKNFGSPLLEAEPPVEFRGKAFDCTFF